MNSRTTFGALRSNSSQIQIIKDFLQSLEDIQKHLSRKRHEVELRAEDKRVEYLKCQEKNYRTKHNDILKRKEFVFSESTDYGLQVSLNATLQILEYLTEEKIGYQFLMTARLNQDALERFFGLMRRQSCGANTHPETRVFGQLFRLLSLYSLAKPIRGSNITGGDMLKTLLNLNDLRAKTNDERKRALDEKLDEIVAVGDELHHITNIANLIDHETLIDESLDEFAIVYVAGYTARKSMKFVNGCQSCIASLKLEDESQAMDEHLLTKSETRDYSNKKGGYLIFPSNKMVNLLR